MSNLFRIFPLAAVITIVAALFSGTPLRAEPESQQPDHYALRPNDLVEIRVFREDDLTSTLRISREGTITFPLIGAVRVGGLSAQAAGAKIRALLAKDYLVNPQVNLTVREYSKRRFTVLGEVQKPGAYEMPDHDSLGLLEAIGMAGGYTRIAEPARITLKRIVDGREKVIRVNAKKMAREGDSGTVEIKPGDVLTVGERLF